ncbi:MAG: GNAT family N-acetyltransferase [Phenylobacterium sp.]|uniref:bifunctional helix-turn-helix transcriptional regulator/GNAT family N-acetyltransferase n=1 Tax=Phenylobacterium sp. TaxID=1871053 RepID=UPI00391BFABB
MTVDTIDPVAAVRGFNRFYTRLIGALDEGHLGSSFTLAEGRALYEIGHGEPLAPRVVAERAGLDPGYLSRILKRFEADDLIARDADPADGRSHLLRLTPKGRTMFGELQGRSNLAVGALLAPLAPKDRVRLTRAMEEVRGLLGSAPAAPEIVVRPHREGELSYTVHRQAVLYSREYGWGLPLEALMARVVAEFIEAFDADRARAFVVDRGGEILGSVFVADGGEGVAKLRLLYLEPAARGLGLGDRLVGECVAFARAAGYRQLSLWTQSVLTSARRIYAAHGFRLVDSVPHTQFGPELIGETWALDL